MAIVTKPVLLDETGKDIKDALDSASATILAAITDGYNKDMTLQEVVDARGNFTSLGQRLTYQKEKTDQLEDELEETLQDVKDYVDDAADKILADITDEFNIDGTLQEVVDARGDFVSLGQRLDSDDERLGVLEQTTRDLEYWKTTNNALPKIEGEGTDITLNDTADSPLTLGFKASESTQNSTTGKNFIPLNDIAQITKNNVTYSCSNQKLKLNGTASNGILIDFDNVTLPAGTYYFNSIVDNPNGSGSYARYITLKDGPNIKTNSGEIILSEETELHFRFYANANAVFNNATIIAQLEEGTTATDYEPYTNGASPNPDYPQDIHVVKGDNEVVIENKNLFDKENVNWYRNNNGVFDEKSNNSTARIRTNSFEIEGGETYTISGYPSNVSLLSIRPYDIDKNKLSDIIMTNDTFTLTDNIKYIHLLFGGENFTNETNTLMKNADIQLQKSTNASSYTEHKEQNYPLSLGVENLYSSQLELGSINTSTGNNEINNNALRSKDYIDVKPNTTYTISNSNDYQEIIYYYDNNKSFISVLNGTNGNQTFTTPNNCYYIRNRTSANNVQNDLTTLYQLEEDNTAHSYSPYGQTLIEMCNINNYADEFFKNVPESEYYDNTLEKGKWYKYGRIGKIVLDGSENWDLSATYTNNTRFTSHSINLGKNTNLISNYFLEGTGGTDTTNIDTNGSTGQLMITISNNIASTVEQLINWLSTHNTLVYYPLQTATKTLLSDTLQEQLDNIYYAMAYQDQTNISQVNEDRPFVINVSTVLDLKTLLTNMN